MAERRMFAKSVVLSDAFLDLPVRSRCLYFTLGMVADDDGFINSPKSVLRQCGAAAADLKRLVEREFLLEFSSGVVVIRHWRVHNQLRKDRHQDTVHVDEMAQLEMDEHRLYVCANRQPSGNQMATQYRKEKNNLVQFSSDQVREGQTGAADEALTQSEKIAHWRAQLQRMEG